ncbi:hypothetical protein ACOMHN_026480 [Nucella lapillus]
MWVPLASVEEQSKKSRKNLTALKKKYKRTQDQRNQTGHGAVTPNPYDHLIEMIIGKESEVIHGIGQKDDCEIFLLKAAEPSLPTFASTAVCQDTEKATDEFPTLAKQYRGEKNTGVCVLTIALRTVFTATSICH